MLRHSFKAVIKLLQNVVLAIEIALITLWNARVYFYMVATVIWLVMLITGAMNRVALGTIGAVIFLLLSHNIIFSKDNKGRD